MADDPDVVQNMIMFKLGELPGGGVALLLGCVAGAEALAKREITSLAIGMTRDMARDLAAKLKAYVDGAKNNR